MEDNRCQLLKLTPSHLALIRDLDNRQSRIRCLIVGGEALSTELAHAVSESFGHQVEIYNEYGPTEATVGCMIYRFDPETEERAWVPIGDRLRTRRYIYWTSGWNPRPNMSPENSTLAGPEWRAAIWGERN